MFLESYTSVKRLIWCVQTFPAEIQESKSPSPSINRQASIETDRVSKEFIEFLKTYHKSGQDIYKQCKLFLDTMSHKRVSDLHVFYVNWGNWWEMEKVLHFFQQFFKQCIQEFSAGVLSQIEDECITVCRFAMVYAAKLKLQYLRYLERTFFCIPEKLVLKDKMPIE